MKCPEITRETYEYLLHDKEFGHHVAECAQCREAFTRLAISMELLKDEDMRQSASMFVERLLKKRIAQMLAGGGMTKDEFYRELKNEELFSAYQGIQDMSLPIAAFEMLYGSMMMKGELAQEQEMVVAGEALAGEEVPDDIRERFAPYLEQATGEQESRLQSIVRALALLKQHSTRQFVELLVPLQNYAEGLVTGKGDTHATSAMPAMGFSGGSDKGSPEARELYRAMTESDDPEEAVKKYLGM